MTKQQKCANITLMSEFDPTFGFDKFEAEQISLEGYCGALLGDVIPALLSRTNEAQKDILYSGQADIDVAFLSYDYLVDGLTSYRIRLVPRQLEEPKPMFRDYGIVRQVIINVPVDFVEDPRSAKEIELALVLIEINTPETTIAQRYVISPSSVKPFTDFADLEFEFKKDPTTEKTKVTNIIVNNARIPHELAQTNTIDRQRDNAEDIVELLKKLVIGNQSVNDGTN